MSSLTMIVPALNEQENIALTVNDLLPPRASGWSASR